MSLPPSASGKRQTEKGEILRKIVSYECMYVCTWCCGLRAVVQRVTHVQSKLEGTRHSGFTVEWRLKHVFTWKGTRHFPGVSKSNAKCHKGISYLRICCRAKTEVIQYKLWVFKVWVHQSCVNYEPMTIVVKNPTTVFCCSTWASPLTLNRVGTSACLM